MTRFKAIGAACALALLSAGAASAGPVVLAPLDAGLSATTVAIVMKGTRAGRMKQRQRTRTTRCNNVPSRC